jgi:hypothetical protein
MYTYIYIHMYAHTYVYIRIYTYMCMHTYIYTCWVRGGIPFFCFILRVHFFFLFYLLGARMHFLYTYIPTYWVRGCIYFLFISSINIPAGCADAFRPAAPEIHTSVRTHVYSGT